MRGGGDRADGFGVSGEDGAEQDVGALIEGGLRRGGRTRGILRVMDDEGRRLVARIEQGHLGCLGQGLAQRGVGPCKRHKQADRGSGARDLAARRRCRRGLARRRMRTRDRRVFLPANAAAR